MAGGDGSSARRRASASGAGWSDARGNAAADSVPPHHPFRTVESRRYDTVDTVGAGAMGTVFVAVDRRLEREVARKLVTDGDRPGDAGRLAREAALTARLEHPNIVPVYDAGVAADGRLYYTMRLIRGRTLAEALGDCADREQRFSLLRHLLAVCDAVAYAHDQGVVHRDLKPANILVGYFGETQVADWGLAHDLEEPGTRTAGEIVGTPGYMSPEQARGEPADPRADVFSLGAVLFEFIAGSRLRTGDRDAVTAMATRGDDDLGALERDKVPGELRAIATKALARRPVDRYANGAELAAELRRFLDGRRVLAHDYTPLELLGRLVRAWRVPLAIAAIGLAGIAIVSAATWQRVRDERNRAVAAEAATRETLAWALDSQAHTAFLAGARAEAEVLAAHALARGESPLARGVLAAVYAGPSPLSVERVDLPGCGRPLAWRGDLVACAGAGTLSLFAAGETAPRWRVQGDATRAAIVDARVVTLEPTGRVRVRSMADGAVERTLGRVSHRTGLVVGRSGVVLSSNGHEVWRVDLATGGRRYLGRPCGEPAVEAMAADRRRFAAVCGDGMLAVANLEGGDVTQRIATPFGPEVKPAYAAALDDVADVAVVGGIGGQAALIDLAAARVHALVGVADGTIASLAVDGRLVAIAPEAGAAAVWDLERGIERLRLPGPASALPVFGDGVLTTAGRALWRWRLGATLQRSKFRAPAGLAAAAVSPDGTTVAAARGDGLVSIWRRREARRMIERPVVAGGVVKRVSFSADGAQVAACSARPGPAGATVVFDAATLGTAPHVASGAGLRRLEFVGGGLVGVRYGRGLSWWREPSVEPVTVGDRAFVDIDRVPGRDAALVIARDGGVWRFEDGALAHLVDDPGAVGVAAGRDGAFATAHANGARWFSGAAGGAPRWVARDSREILDAALSPDGALLAVATRRGAVDVWSLRDGELLAVLNGHRERVAHVGFGGDDGRLLSSAGWDGVVQLWHLDVLDRPASALIEAAETRWGLRLDDALNAWRP